jgi:hypothetical protein
MAAPPLAAGDPFGYRRSDGVNAVIFRDTFNRIVELRIERGGAPWVAANLFDNVYSTTGVMPPDAAGDPTAYRRADGANSIVYRGFNGQVHELYQLPVPGPNIPWRWKNLTADARVPSSAFAATFKQQNNPVGYTRSDGPDSVVYISQDGHVHELQMSGNPLLTPHWLHVDWSYNMCMGCVQSLAQ